VQGGEDQTVPASQSLAFQEKLRAAGVTCDLILIPEGQHRIADWAKFDPAWQGRLVAWLDEKLAAQSSQRGPPIRESN
jgi:dipeptidyl aminopeptidase/acylaminoacyl peptidase